MELQSVLQRGGEVAKVRRVEVNILSTIEQLEICLPVFKMYHKLQQQLSEKRYPSTEGVRSYSGQQRQP